MDIRPSLGATSDEAGTLRTVIAPAPSLPDAGGRTDPPFPGEQPRGSCPSPPDRDRSRTDPHDPAACGAARPATDHRPRPHDAAPERRARASRRRPGVPLSGLLHAGPSVRPLVAQPSRHRQLGGAVRVIDAAAPLRHVRRARARSSCSDRSLFAWGAHVGSITSRTPEKSVALLRLMHTCGRGGPAAHDRVNSLRPMHEVGPRRMNDAVVCVSRKPWAQPCMRCKLGAAARWAASRRTAQRGRMVVQRKAAASTRASALCCA
jgi:hypothetical protein